MGYYTCVLLGSLSACVKERIRLFRLADTIHGLLHLRPTWLTICVCERED